MHARIIIFFFVASMLLYSVAWGQTQTPTPAPAQSMPGMDMSGHDMSKMKDAPAGEKDADNDAGAHVMHSMEGHMDMGPHMKMTALRPVKPGDSDRAQQVVISARAAADKYKDFHTALSDGFKIFLPNFPQKIYHFTNYGYGMEAAFHFNP